MTEPRKAPLPTCILALAQTVQEFNYLGNSGTCPLKMGDVADPLLRCPLCLYYQAKFRLFKVIRYEISRKKRFFASRIEAYSRTQGHQNLYVTMGLLCTVSKINGDFGQRSQSFFPARAFNSHLRGFPYQFQR